MHKDCQERYASILAKQAQLKQLEENVGDGVLELDKVSHLIWDVIKNTAHCTLPDTKGSGWITSRGYDDLDRGGGDEDGDESTRIWRIMIVGSKHKYRHCELVGLLLGCMNHLYRFMTKSSITIIIYTIYNGLFIHKRTL